MPDPPQDPDTLTEDEPQDRQRGGLVGLGFGLVTFVAVLALWRPDAATLPAGVDAWDLTAVAATACLMAIWWMTEAVPIPVTSLLPMVLLPVLVGEPFDLSRVAGNYANWQVYLFFGGFLVAIAMEASGLHRRIALRTVRAIGTDPWRIVLGFMVASAFLSMWISNTATALMMLPIGSAVVRHFQGRRRFGEALMLGIAYGASIGGVATPIGTPPNIAFQGIYGRLYPEAPAISFAGWMAFAVPLVVVFLPLAWLVLVRGVRRGAGDARSVLRDELARLGPWTAAQKRVLAVFVATALLWVFRQPLDLGAVRIPGWSALFPGAAINDGVVAMAMGLLLFLVPSGDDTRRLLRWRVVERKMPWGILLLFGGGFALADSLSTPGVAAWIGSHFAFLSGFSPLLVIAASASVLTFLTELTSNTATAQLMLPLAAGVAITSVGMNPLVMMLPVTVAASFAFMLPVATPPNAVVFGSGAVPMRAMIRKGLVLNLVGIVVLTILCRFLAPLVFGIDLDGGVPPWAQ